jgi:peroxiredoxin
MTHTAIHRLAVGDPAPDFELESAAGGTEALRAAESSATVVVITSNECPYALAWQPRIEQAAQDYAGRGVRTLLVLPNDPATRPRDAPTAVRARFDAGELPLPVLFDSDQRVARAYTASATPEVYVVDASGVLRYRGAPDRSHADESLRADYLRSALDSILDGDAVPNPTTPASGCSIKWRIELLWWEGCPSHHDAEDLLRSTLVDLGREEVGVARRQIRTRAEAEDAGFPGSPTFQVGGVDLFPVDAPPLLACRIYERDGRPSPLPGSEELAAQIKDVLARPWDLPGFVDPRTP